jgi:hypothetical protein
MASTWCSSCQLAGPNVATFRVLFLCREKVSNLSDILTPKHTPPCKNVTCRFIAYFSMKIWTVIALCLALYSSTDKSTHTGDQSLCLHDKKKCTCALDDTAVAHMRVPVTLQALPNSDLNRHTDKCHSAGTLTGGKETVLA